MENFRIILEGILTIGHFKIEPGLSLWTSCFEKLREYYGCSFSEVTLNPWVLLCVNLVPWRRVYAR